MSRLSHLFAFSFAAVFCASASLASTSCENKSFDGIRYTACTVDVAEADLRLFLNDANGEKYGQFTAVETALNATGERLVFAMNGGMYHDDREPVGHYLENGREVMRVIPNAGPGNFGLLPNGVFCIRETRADVIETLTYQANRPDCQYATQSGPMLVIDGALHPRFLIDSTSRHIRNGVGTTEDGQTAVFVISDDPTTFHEFGRIFRDDLKMPQALFLDGRVSRLYAPSLDRFDFGRWMGPIVGVVTPQ